MLRAVKSVMTFFIKVIFIGSQLIAAFQCHYDVNFKAAFQCHYDVNFKKWFV